MKISPSKLDRAFACPGSVGFMEEALKYPKKTNAAAERGTELHRVILAAISAADRSMIDELIQGNDILKQEAYNGYNQLAEMLGDFLGTDSVEVEVVLDMSELDMEKTGREGEHQADIRWYDEKNKVLHIADYKSGRSDYPEPPDNKQLLAYAYAALKEYPETKLVAMYLCQPKVHDHAITGYSDRKHLDGFAALVLKLKDFGKEFNPNTEKQCRFCDGRETCGALSNFMQEKKMNKESKQLEIEESVTSGTPLIIEPAPAIGPVVVMSAEAVGKAKGFLKKVTDFLGITVENQQSAADLLSEITKFESAVEKNRKQVKKPLLDFGKEIDAAAKQALEPLGEAKGSLKDKINKFMQEQEDLRQKAQAAKDKAESEARAKAQELAEKAAKTRSKAQKAKLEEEARKQAEIASQTAKQATPEPVPKVSGLRKKKVWKYKVLNLEKAPETFVLKTVNDPLVTAAIKAGQLKTCEWVEVWCEEQVMAGGR